MVGLKPKSDERNCKILGLNVDSVDKHKARSRDIEDTQGHAAIYPLIGNSNLDVAKNFGILPAEVSVPAVRWRAVAPPGLFEVAELSPHGMIGAKRLQVGSRPTEVRVGLGNFEPRLLECGQHFGRTMDHGPGLER